MTKSEAQHILQSIHYYDQSNAMYSKWIMPGKYRHIPALHEVMVKIAEETINRNNKQRSAAMKLLEYAANERDKDILYRYYVLCQNYFDIGEDLFYSYNHVMRLKADALKRLAQNVTSAGNDNKILTEGEVSI